MAVTVIALKRCLHSKAVLLHCDFLQAVLKGNAQTWYAALSVSYLRHILRMAHFILCVSEKGGKKLTSGRGGSYNPMLDVTLLEISGSTFVSF